MADVRTNCPMCGHAVKVVGRTTQHYEPVGCLRLEDDHQVCDQTIQRLREVLQATRDELDRWGWGDSHWGEQPQERSVVDAVALADRVLKETV